MESVAVKAMTEAGLAIGFGIAGILLLFFIVKHVLRQQEKILDMATVQNNNWQKSLDEHTSQAKAFHEQVAEAHKYQREEHSECHKNIGNICSSISTMDEKDKLFRSYVTENLEVRRKQQEKISETLDNVANILREVTAKLGTINGIKHK